MNDHFADVGKNDGMSLTLALIVLDRLNTSERIDVARDNLAEAVRVVSAAAKYRIAQKPEPESRYYGNGKCPTCGAVFLDKSTNYCGNCGQALDWSD
jgi:ribosomal protein S27AE